MKLWALLSMVLLAGCTPVSWHNVRDPSRNFHSDRSLCEETRASDIGITHCMRTLGWDAQLGDTP